MAALSQASNPYSLLSLSPIIYNKLKVPKKQNPMEFILYMLSLYPSTQKSLLFVGVKKMFRK